MAAPGAGSLDPTLNNDGMVVTPVGGFSGYDDGEGQAVAVQSDGKFVVAGYSLDSNDNQDFALARYNADGSLDATFGGGTGTVLTPFAGGASAANSVAVDGSGNIIVAGYATDPNSGATDFAVAAL